MFQFILTKILNLSFIIKFNWSKGTRWNQKSGSALLKKKISDNPNIKTKKMFTIVGQLYQYLKNRQDASIRKCSFDFDS